MLAEIILPLPLAQTYTYFVPQEFENQIAVGQRVVVNFGTKKFYTGIVEKIFEGELTENLKPISQLLDNEPIITENQLKFWHQIAEYYCAPLGDVYKAAVPALLRKDDNKKRRNYRAVEKKVEEQQHILTTEQQICLEKIENDFKEKNSVLLNGITSSGKTEIYIHLITKALEQNQQVLYLVPEIGLTSQLVERLQRIFGEKLIAYHSKITDLQRAKIWNELLQHTENKVVIGTRSSVFLPFQNLGLIIVDEEHDSSFKQNDASPRYNARSAAGFLGQIFGAKVLLGSATPSIESYANAQFGKFGYAELTTRFQHQAQSPLNHPKGNFRVPPIESVGYTSLNSPLLGGQGGALPDIQLIDINEMYYKKRMRGHFSLELIDKIEQTLAKNEQVILFQNRRGFSLAQECPDCGFVRKCPKCDVSLTWHKFTNVLSCHYCGYVVQNQRVCQKCGSINITNRGFGTEQVEQEAAELFPNAKIGRLDFDTTRKKASFGEILAFFEQNKLDILVGTQMVSKGIDFSNVGLVGVMNADNLMNFPDFRSHENAFQTLVQVSGRAGRKAEQSSVIIQTFSPQSPLLQCVKNNDYQLFFKTQMAERQLFNYPPYCRLVQLTLKHKNEEIVQKAAEIFVEILSKNSVFAVLGPDNPAVSKVQYLHLRKILLKTHNSVSYKIINHAIFESINILRQNADYKYINVAIDVDSI